MPFRLTTIFCLTLMAYFTSARVDASPQATLLLHDGKIWTGDEQNPAASALAVLGERIVFVGSDDDAARWRGPQTRVIELAGRRVVPGFIDSHVHFVDGGEEILAPDLRSARSEDEFARRLAAAAAELPAGTWLTAGSWDHENWPGGELPTKTLLDRHVPEHPVFVARLDGHMALANGLAMRLAGISRETRAPEGGEIERDEDGEPTGVFKDNAMGLVRTAIPPRSREDRRRFALAAIEHAARLGVSGVHDVAVSLDDFAVYQELLAEGLLTVRVTLYPPLATRASWETVRVRRGFGNDRLRICGLKGFADGSLGSSTAYFLAPYLDDPGEDGLPIMDLGPGGPMERHVRATVAAGLQPAIHAIGDRAIREVLDIFAGLAGEATSRRARARVEHAQHIHPADLDRFAALGVVASMQPYHAIDDGRWAEDRIGKERCATTYAFRDLLDRAAALAFGSDWPVASLSPMEGIYAAVTRRTLDGKHPEGWIPAQRIRVEEAVRAYTAGSAYAGFAESEVGVLKPDFLADLVVLSEDIFTIEPASIRDVRVDLTVAGGAVVHER